MKKQTKKLLKLRVEMIGQLTPDKLLQVRGGGDGGGGTLCGNSNGGPTDTNNSLHCVGF